MITQLDVNIAKDELFTCRDFLRWGESCLRCGGVFHGHGFDNPGDEVLHLLLHVLHLPPNADPRLLDARLVSTEKEQFLALLCRRVNLREPTPYLTGEAWFCGQPFKVDERVLIPRSPIGELVENRFQPWLDSLPHRILDLCTGSGCIAIVLAQAFPEAKVDASDISSEALALARSNLADYGLEEQVNLSQGDGLSAISGCYDLIVCNPPYVDAEEMAAIPEEYRYEPALALASGNDGLDFVRGLLAEAGSHLTEKGILVVEVGSSAPALEAAFPDLPFFWFAFERGGEGVFMLTREQLVTAGYTAASGN